VTAQPIPEPTTAPVVLTAPATTFSGEMPVFGGGGGSRPNSSPTSSDDGQIAHFSPGPSKAKVPEAALKPKSTNANVIVKISVVVIDGSKLEHRSISGLGPTAYRESWIGDVLVPHGKRRNLVNRSQ